MDVAELKDVPVGQAKHEYTFPSKL
jgi:hypothetical protein